MVDETELRALAEVWRRKGRARQVDAELAGSPLFRALQNDSAAVFAHCSGDLIRLLEKQANS